MPDFCNPFDFFLTVIQEKENEKNLFSSYPRILEGKINAEKENLHEKFENIQIESLKKNLRQVSWCLEFWILLQRGTLNFFRNKSVLYARISQYVINTVILMGFFWNIGGKNNLLFNVLGFFFNNCNNFFINGIFTSIFMIPLIRQIIKREYSAKLYRISTFFCSLVIIFLIPSLIYSAIFSPVLFYTIKLETNFLMFFYYFLLNFFVYALACYFGVMIGSTFGDELSLIVSPFVFVLFMLGSGYFRSNQSFPKAFSFLNWISPYRYMMELYILIEEDANDVTGRIGETMGYTVGIEVCFAVLAGYLLLALFLGYVSIKVYASKF